MASAVSSIRLEKPHSLSYQAITFTRRSWTRVWLVSKMAEWALWLKSMETSGWVLTASTGDDSAARVTIALISSRVVLRPAVNTRSTRETRSEERRVGKECRSRWSTYH